MDTSREENYCGVLDPGECNKSDTDEDDEGTYQESGMLFTLFQQVALLCAYMKLWYIMCCVLSRTAH